MEPFVSKIANLSLSSLPPNDGAHPWGFLRDWTSPINEGNLEKLSQRGKDDAFEFGGYIRSIYKELFVSLALPDPNALALTIDRRYLG